MFNGEFDNHLHRKVVPNGVWLLLHVVKIHICTMQSANMNLRCTCYHHRTPQSYTHTVHHFVLSFGILYSVLVILCSVLPGSEHKTMYSGCARSMRTLLMCSLYVGMVSGWVICVKYFCLFKIKPVFGKALT